MRAFIVQDLSFRRIAQWDGEMFCSSDSNGEHERESDEDEKQHAASYRQKNDSCRRKHP